MNRGEIAAAADFLAEMAIVDELLGQGVIDRADRERARESLLGDVGSPLCGVVTEEPCYKGRPE